jgi:hypothetical protein
MLFLMKLMYEVVNEMLCLFEGVGCTEFRPVVSSHTRDVRALLRLSTDIKASLLKGVGTIRRGCQRNVGTSDSGHSTSESYFFSRLFSRS